MSIKNYFVIATVIILTAILSLAPHGLILQYCPNPSGVPILEVQSRLPDGLNFLLFLSVVTCCFLIYCILQNYLNTRIFFVRSLWFTLLLLAFHGALRQPIMNLIVGLHFNHALVIFFSENLMFIICALWLCWVMPIAECQSKMRLLYYSTAFFFTTLITFFGSQAGHWVRNSFLPLLPPMDQSHIVMPPYEINVLIPTYMTFIEPGLASFIIFHFLKGKLHNFSTLTQGFIMAALIVSERIGPFLGVFYSEGNIFYRIFYYGQFLWEYLTLGILTVYGTRFIIQQVNSPWIDKKNNLSHKELYV